MQQGLEILFNTYWSSKGWKSGEITVDDFRIAKTQGFMFDYPKPYCHVDAMKRAKELVRSIHPDDVANAFLFSLSTRQLEYRSALGSYYYIRSIPEHEEMLQHGCYCSICGFSMYKTKPDEYEKRHGLNILNFERYKWGGVRHDQLNYAIFDLEQFSKLSKVYPQKGDFLILKSILDSAGLLEPTQKIGAYSKLISSKKIIRSNRAEIDIALNILGICDVFNSKSCKGYIHSFTKDDGSRDPIEYKNDFKYPANRWHASDGINWGAINYVFGQL